MSPIQELFAEGTELRAETAEQLRCKVGEFERFFERRKSRMNVENSKNVVAVGEDIKLQMKGEIML